jgi:putative transposon-encoded protein
MNDNKIMEVRVQAYQVIEKKVSEGTKTSGRIYVPKEWVGKTVKIFLMDNPELK